VSVPFARFVEALGARQSGENYVACCIGHEDRHPSLTIKQAANGKTLIYCHAGCDTRNRLIPLLEQRGLWPVETDPECQPTTGPTGPVAPRPPLDPADFPPYYLDFNRQLVLPKRQVTERYLWARGIAVSELQDILHHPRAYHQPTGTWWPCMVAAARDVAGYLRSVHRTFLSHMEPPGKAALGGVVIDPVRMLWVKTSVKGCAVHLAPAAREMLVAEGIESTASAMKLLSMPGWASLSAGNLRHVELPASVRAVVIAADNDSPGIAAAIAAAQRFRREGRQVRVVKPVRVKDFNDVLIMGERYAG
jgi:hypothetical protein